MEYLMCAADNSTKNGGRVRRCNQHIREALELARRLIILSDEGDSDSQDDGCHVLYGILRDCAYKIRAQAEREREAHILKGVWERTPSSGATPGSEGQ